MNWYKKAQQENNPLGQPPAGSPQVPAQLPAQPQQPQPEQDVLEQLSEAPNLQAALNVLKQHGIQYREVKWQGGAAPVYIFEDQKRTDQILEGDQDSVYINDAYSWLSDLNELTLDNYIPTPDFNQTFWDDVGKGSIVYHGTPSENIPSIKAQGLSPKNESRGFSNRYTPDAVFTSEEPEQVASYGDTVIEIDLGAMKAAGYMPHVERESGQEENEQKAAIAWRLGLEDYTPEDRSWEGISDQTLVIHGPIPPQFLRFQ